MKKTIPESLRIAKTIRHQLYATGFLKVGSWGAQAFTVIDNGLQFYVEGKHFKGHIRIIYDYGLPGATPRECTQIFKNPSKGLISKL